MGSYSWAHDDEHFILHLLLLLPLLPLFLQRDIHCNCQFR
jgi:hypothetical protein